MKRKLPAHDFLEHLPAHREDRVPTAMKGFGFFTEEGMLHDQPPTRILNYAFSLTTQGTATKLNGLQVHQLCGNTMAFAFPGQIISYYNLSPDLKFYYCIMGDDFFAHPQMNRNVLNSFEFFREEGNPVFKLTDQTAGAVIDLLQKIQKEYLEKHMDSDTLIRLYLHELFLKVKRDYIPVKTRLAQSTGRGEVLARAYKELLSQHFRENKSLAFYAGLLCVTPKHLSEMVKEQTGRPAGYWLTEMEMLEAKVLLKHSDNSIGEIASGLSYEDARSFSKMFKRMTGLTPSEYRGS